MGTRNGFHRPQEAPKAPDLGPVGKDLGDPLEAIMGLDRSRPVPEFADNGKRVRADRGRA